MKRGWVGLLRGWRDRGAGERTFLGGHVCGGGREQLLGGPDAGRADASQFPVLPWIYDATNARKETGGLAVALDDVVGEGAQGIGVLIEAVEGDQGGIAGAAGEGAGGGDAEDFGVGGFVLF